MKAYSRDHGRNNGLHKANEGCFINASMGIISCICRCMDRMFERLRNELFLFTAYPSDGGRNIKVFMLSLSVSDFRV